MKKIAAGQFKATSLKLMDRVAAAGEPIEVTKRGKPLVRLVPAHGGAENDVRVSSAQRSDVALLDTHVWLDVALGRERRIAARVLRRLERAATAGPST